MRRALVSWLMNRNSTILLSLLAAATSALAQPVLTVNGLNANYTTTHVFVDEVAGDAVPLTILFTPNTNNLTQVEFFSTLNRRDRATTDADGDGVEDGIRQPSGDLVVAGADTHDCELGASGVFHWSGAGNPGNWQPTDAIRNRESRV